jgi:CheY-like chemotaxis protein
MSGLANKKILIVEDESLVGYMAREKLLELGADVVALVPTLEKAKDLAGTAMIDAALLDANLRGASAQPVADLLHRRGIPVVLATGYGSPSSITSPAVLLNKPYTLEMLSSAMERALQNAPAPGASLE